MNPRITLIVISLIFFSTLRLQAQATNLSTPAIKITQAEKQASGVAISQDSSKIQFIVPSSIKPVKMDSVQVLWLDSLKTTLPKLEPNSPK